MELYRGDLERDLVLVSRNRLAERITGGLSRPSKMPELAWGIPATRCQLGATLIENGNSVCASCYARKGRYRLRHVKEKLEQRYQGLSHPLWVPSMVLLIRYYVGRYFRWFDSGDVLGCCHLANICLVATHTPDVRHWLPTQEHEVVRRFEGKIPDNLTIRLSGHIVDDPPPPDWPQTSTVFTKTPPPHAHVCPAPQQENYCGCCRACWDRNIGNVAYRKH